MLVSLANNLAFAHYPKTAGSSVATWFFQTFPDAQYVRAGDPHTHVRRSLACLTGGRSLSAFQRLQFFSRTSNWRHQTQPTAGLETSIRIFGIVRPPFAMLASLAAYWRRVPPMKTPNNRFATAAREGRFSDFVRLATSGRLPSYRKFFDVGGPAWANTRLIHFEDLETGLQTQMNRWGIDCRFALPQVNCRPSGSWIPDPEGALDARLQAAVRRHFSWYYETWFDEQMPRATCTTPHTQPRWERPRQPTRMPLQRSRHRS